MALDRSPLRLEFARAARPVRWALGLRSVASGIGVGSVLGAGMTALAWHARLGPERPWVAAGGAGLGLILGLVLAFRRRWSDANLALYLDASLDSKESVTTALEFETAASDEKTPAAVAVITEHALAALASRRQRRIRPAILNRWHILLPIGAATSIAFCALALPPSPPAPAVAPGVEQVRTNKLRGLEKIEALAELGGTTPEQRERLKRIAEEAKKLRADLARGVEKREALSSIAKLRDDIAAERMKFGDAQNRAGLDAAVDALGHEKSLERAARALSAGDLVAFDDEMQRIANLAEKTDRDAAKQALSDTAKAAREKGSKALADALERERKKLEEAESKAETLREFAHELGKGLDQDGRQALEDYEKNGSPEAQRRLVESMERALRGLSEEERRRLAENLRKRADHGAGRMQPMSRAELEDLARRLSEKDADRQLQEELRELARKSPSDDAQREHGLEEGDRGGAEAERQLGALPMPSQGQSGGNGGGKDPSKADSVNQDGSGGPGGEHDEGKGNHDGQTKALDGSELRSKADAKVLPGGPMHQATRGRAPARPGETANQLGTGSLGAVGQTEIGAVEGTEIPEEYREQVGRYFEP